MVTARRSVRGTRQPETLGGWWLGARQLAPCGGHRFLLGGRCLAPGAELKPRRGPVERIGMPAAPSLLEALQHLVSLLIGVSIGFAVMHALRG